MNSKSIYRFLPLITAALAGAVIGLALSQGGSTRTVTTTTVIPQSAHAGQPASFSSSKAYTIHQLFEMDDPGVVDINTQSVQNTGGLFNFGGQQQVQGEGAGVVFDNKGDIITDEHVIAGANQITVNFPNGHSASARIVGSDTGADVGVIRVNVPRSWLHPLPFANSDDVQVGDAVIAIGSPFSQPNTVTAGIVSATGRTITAPSPSNFTIANAIQTDAPINPGNSGGPLINAVGQVIGLNDQIDTNTQDSTGQGQSSGVGFATPSNADVRIANEIISTGKAQNAYVGICLAPSGKAAVASQPSTTCQQPVVPGGPAAKAGLKPGDVITAVNGKRVTNVNQFIGTVAGYSPGNTVTLTVNRGGQVKDLRLTLGVQPSSASGSQGGPSVP
jgi:putative serine protease PepD